MTEFTAQMARQLRAAVAIGAAFVLLATAFFFAAPVAAQSQDQDNTQLATHMGHMLVGSADWRTPNRELDPENPNSPVEFSVRWKWGPNKQHIVGSLFGVTADGREAQYHSMYVMFDPVAERVVMQQVGWDGTYYLGKATLRSERLSEGDRENVDLIGYGMDGVAKISRHEVTISDAQTHSINVFERGDDGAWVLTDTSIWRLEE